MHDAIVHEAFLTFDRNGDGYIDKAELRAGMTSTGMLDSYNSGEKTDAVNTMMKLLDDDRDGRVSFREFKRHFHSVFKDGDSLAIRAAFLRFDVFRRGASPPLSSQPAKTKRKKKRKYT